MASLGAAHAQAPKASVDAPATQVTPDNFVRAETDMYLVNLIKKGGVGIGKLQAQREPASVEDQAVVRPNRDTLYSTGVFDLDAGPLTITLPDPGKRFVSMQVINEDHYVPNVFYGGGTHTLTRKNVGTRYVVVAMRALVDPNSAADLKQVHALQDATQVKQKSQGKLELPNWDPASQKKVRDALLALQATAPDFKGAFGKEGEVDPVRHLMGTAAAWGGNPDKDAMYLNITPEKNDGKTVYRLSVKNVPVDGFWSVSVYNAEGYFQKNEANAYALNSVTAKKGADGAATIQFGGCEAQTVNCLPTMPGWNYTVRLYRPRAEVLSGKWTFPQPQAIN
ncbi:MAG: DUF1254 domain-containing protein [Proteobacteria bacterium]|nr:DUF1254 domain-containing protein [Pseudomonadota bacterium]